jgi:hypothetical protein
VAAFLDLKGLSLEIKRALEINGLIHASVRVPADIENFFFLQIFMYFLRLVQIIIAEHGLGHFSSPRYYWLEDFFCMPREKNYRCNVTHSGETLGARQKFFIIV